MISRRTSLLWPLLILVVAALWIAQSLAVLPTSIVELISRAWPVLLVTLGLMLFLGRRVRFGNVIAIGLSVVVVGGMMAAAYGQQGQQFSTAQQKPFTQAIDPKVTSVNIVVNTLNTQIDVTPGDSTGSTLTGKFVGSNDSVVTTDYKVDGTTGTFTLGEAQNSGIPSLESLGRGKLTLTLPIGPQITQVSVTIKGHAGDITFDSAGTALTALTMTADTGAIKLATLPDTVTALTITANAVTLNALPKNLASLAVTAASNDIALDASSTSLKMMAITANAGAANVKLPNKAGLIGTIKASGDITLTVPATIAASIKMAGNASNNPTYNQGDYILTIDKTLISRRSNDQQQQITVDTPGHATIQ